MAIEIVDFPMKNGDFPWQNVSSPEGKNFMVLISWNISRSTMVISWCFFFLIGFHPIFHLIFHQEKWWLVMCDDQNLTQNDETWDISGFLQFPRISKSSWLSPHYCPILLLMVAKSCTTLDGWNPINNGINHLSTGVGFLPSTVVTSSHPEMKASSIQFFLSDLWTRRDMCGSQMRSAEKPENHISINHPEMNGYPLVN